MKFLSNDGRRTSERKQMPEERGTPGGISDQIIIEAVHSESWVWALRKGAAT